MSEVHNRVCCVDFEEKQYYFMVVVVATGALGRGYMSS